VKSSFYKADNISIFLDMKLADMISIAESAFACGVASGVYGKKTESGTCTSNPVYAYIDRINKIFLFCLYPEHPV